ncbi:MAG: tetratricopeptide repeat protein [Candidatus Riflebacteria bacterium]|nr:tetratricopeptide repeat protein [Candidatus Riflebacteria bacterium]
MRGRGPMMGKDPKELEAMREQQKRNQMLRTKAEGHKNLAELYASQDKIDEAVAELKKILALSEQADVKEVDRLSKQLGQVYMEMAELYMKKDRFEDAKKVLTEGADKMKGTQPELAARLFLNLGNLLRKKGAPEEAEKAFKKSIEISAGELDKGPAKK